MFLFANLKVRVWQAAQFGPPALQVAAKRASVICAQLVDFGDPSINSGHGFSTEMTVVMTGDEGEKTEDRRRRTGEKDRGPRTEDGGKRPRTEDGENDGGGASKIPHQFHPRENWE